MESKCLGCLRPTPNYVTVVGDGWESDPMAACGKYMEKWLEESDNHKAIFEALIAGGIKRELANAVVIAYMEKCWAKVPTQ